MLGGVLGAKSKKSVKKDTPVCLHASFSQLSHHTYQPTAMVVGERQVRARGPAELARLRQVGLAHRRGLARTAGRASIGRGSNRKRGADAEVDGQAERAHGKGAADERES